MTHSLVLGGMGFVGSHLVDSLLARGDRVTVVDNLFTGRRENLAHVADRVEFVRHDVCEPFHFDGVDVVWHLACPASPVAYQRNPARTIETAVLGTRNALRFAREVGARLLITSTSEVYGDPMVHPQPETYWGNVDPVGPRSMYDEGKRAGEALAAAWVGQYRTDVRVVRLFNVYGGRMDLWDGRVIPTFVRQAMAGERLTIYGDGQQTRSFAYVADVVDALVRVMAPPYSELVGGREPLPILNVGCPDERTILRVAGDVLSACGVPEHLHHGMVSHLPALPSDPRQRKPDISRIQRLVGWEPKTTYEVGLRETVEWFRGDGR